MRKTTQALSLTLAMFLTCAGVMAKQPCCKQEKIDVADDEVAVGSTLQYDTSSYGGSISLATILADMDIQINEVVKKTFIVTWSIGNKTYWINKEENEDGSEVFVTININHPFFKPYSNNEDFKIVLEKFVISFVVAEEQAKLVEETQKENKKLEEQEPAPIAKEKRESFDTGAVDEYDGYNLVVTGSGTATITIIWNTSY